MNFQSIIEPAELIKMIQDPNLCVLDCRFSLEDTNSGRHEFQKGHIPGAQYSHLDDDLSGPITEFSSRHPLPSINVFVDKLSNWGIDEQVQVVVYDGSNGMVASRLWWMLQWLGHENVAVLNGGFQNWESLDLPIEKELHIIKRKDFQANLQQERLVQGEKVEDIREKNDYLLVDSRAPERFSGEEENLDSNGGHIPGAVNLFYQENLDENDKFLSKEILKKRFSILHGDIAIENIIYYCGSGVSANHNLVAIKYAGLGIAKLYAGSWSEWITDPKRPIESSKNNNM